MQFYEIYQTENKKLTRKIRFFLENSRIRASTESTVICFTFNTKVTNALLFWRELMQYTANKPLKHKRRRTNSCLFQARVNYALT